MHDFMLAKEIIDELKKIIQEKKIDKIKSVNLEIGMVSLAHDGHPEHAEDMSIENLEFGLKSITKNTPLENIKFNIKKIAGEHWQINNVEM
ncbi:MAG: hydrogenase/urease maturation nickel metallochaperone HypA [Candidatus Moraniibacteriota bacterium]